MQRLLLLPVCLAAAAAISITGCGFQSEEPQADGGELRFVSGAPIDTLDPQGTSWLVDFRVIEGLFEPLLRVNPATLALEPAAAEALPEVSEDGLTYTYRLRADAKWSNGDAVKASDYVHGWSRALLPDFAADYAGLFFCIDGAEDYFTWRSEQLADFANAGQSAEELWADSQARFVETVGLEAVDDRTIRVRLREPTAYFNELVAFAAFMPIHEASAKQFMDLDPASGLWTMRSAYFSEPDNLVGNGPYRLTEWTFKRRMILDQNPHYWNKDAMGNTRVVMEVNSDEGNALLNYAQGQYDWYPNLSTSSTQAPDLVNSGRSDVHVGPAAGTVFYIFNCRPTLDDGQPNPLADPQVRRALAMAVDRDLIVTSITRLNEPTATTMTPVGSIPGYEPPTDAAPPFDPEAARKLLAEAGYPNGEGLSGLTILYNTEAPHEKLAAALANMWQTQLGVTVLLDGVEKSRFRQRRKNGGFTISRGNWYGDYRDPTTFLDLYRANDGNNDAGYASGEYDRLLREAAAQTAPAKRFALLRDAEAVMLADAPIVPLHQPINLELFDPAAVKNLYPNAWNYRDLAAIAVETKSPKASGVQ
ncbi:MAG: peptide ABC transporter substrate-binding protein [Planctomycetota bacterium]